MVVVVPAFGANAVISGYRGGGDICPPLPEYHSPVHCDLSTTGSVSGGVALFRNVGDMLLMGAGVYQPEGHEIIGGGNRGGFVRVVGGRYGGSGGRGRYGDQYDILTGKGLCSN